jgi:hypothetical protein
VVVVVVVVVTHSPNFKAARVGGQQTAAAAERGRLWEKSRRERASERR